MKSYVFLLLLFIFICSQKAICQTNSITIDAVLNTENHTLSIQQQTVYYNKTNTPLASIYFHNWANAYKHKHTPLAKRLLENYSKAFHFAKEKHRGFSKIESITSETKTLNWVIDENQIDILKVELNTPLQPNDSVVINAKYTVKIPKDRYTEYGVNSGTYNLRYWYLSPAVYTTKWELFNNLDLDDLYSDFTHFNIALTTPKDYQINSNLIISNTFSNGVKMFKLKGKSLKEAQLNISKINNYYEVNFNDVTITSNIAPNKLDLNLKTEILKREYYFLYHHLGKLLNTNLYLDKIEYDKNPVYGFSQLPSFLAPYDNAFEYDVTMFKQMAKKYIEQLYIINQREDGWLADGIQHYLMMKYVERYYPNTKAIGKLANIWGVRSSSLAQLKFNDKYPYVYQFAARKNLDQAITTPKDSLSNFNRKIVNKYKAGIAIQFLNDYLDDINFHAQASAYLNSRKNKALQSDEFIKYFEKISSKNLDWFKNDYLNTSKKIDYTIKKVEVKNDSIDVTIKNKRHIATPIQLYGIKGDSIKFKKWLPVIDSTKTVTIAKNGFERVSLNYEFHTPEINLRNNWQNVKKGILNRPLKPRFILDVENPYYNQFFYKPVAKYNYYDGLVLGMNFSNSTFLKKHFEYKVTPSFGLKSKKISGSFGLLYEILPENEKIKHLKIGMVGSTYQYAPNLSYTKYSPFATLEFKRNSMRSVRSKSVYASYVAVDKETSPTQTTPLEANNYNVLNIGFNYARPEIIEDVRFSTGLELANKFSKLSVTGRYRKLTNANRQFDFRVFAGIFLRNETTSDYFSFALDRPTDYLFQYNYIGRSETSGILSQQIIINEGGFKSKLDTQFANQWLTTVNTSVSVWRWFEIYNDVGFVKNKHASAYFAHEHGVRLNFVQDILELYFPVYSNLGWEINQEQYSSKIRFVLVLKPKRIFNFFKRGFY